MATKSRTKRARRRRRGEALVHSHLERVSRDLLALHPDIVRGFIGRNAGVYALYRKNRLYYVGLASRLSSRLKSHIRDQHGQSWDRFSIYLTIKDQHIKEIESLLLRIARPLGNKVGGKPAGSRDLRRRILRAIRVKQRQENKDLIDGGRLSKKNKQTPNKGDERLLLRLLPQGGRLKGTLKDAVYHAKLRPDGRIRFKGALYPSLSTAAYAAIKRPTNGWWFWQVELSRGHWVRLTRIREAGTPVYAR